MSGGVWDVERLRFATSAGGMALWSWSADTDRVKVRDLFEATRNILGETGDRLSYHSRNKNLMGSARGKGEDKGIVGRLMYGVIMGVSVRKLAE